MEKLQPVIKQIFWILFGLALLLVLIGWWSAKGDLSTQIDARKSAVNKAFTDAQQNVSSVPNSKWWDGAQAKNNEHRKDFGDSAKGLRQEQLSARTYPAGIRDELNKLKYGSKIEKKTLREQFARLYRKYFYEQIKVIKPFINGEGLVDVGSARVTQEDPNRWRTVRPTSPEIWNAQEDIWLLRSLLDSIAAVNEGADRIDKAPIRALLMLQLRGGDPDAPIGGSAGGGGFGGGGGEGYEDEQMRGMSGFGGGGGSGGGSGGASEVWRSYEGSMDGDLLTEEFGSSGDSGGGMSGGGMSSGGMSSGGMDGYEDEDGGGDSSGGDSGKRYVDDGELYRSRAFQLEVKILQQEIPSLLAELTNSSFPVEIVRVDASFGGAPSGAGSQLGGGYEGGAEDSYEGGDGGGQSSSMGSSMGGMGSSMGGMGSSMGGMGSSMGGMGSSMGGGGSGLGNLSFGGSSTGLGTGTTRAGSAAGSRAQAKKKQIGERLRAAAMADPNVATVRVAGLMTMYISQEENEAQEGAEAAAETESQEAGGVDLPPNEMLIDTVEQDQSTDTGDAAVPGENSGNGVDPTTPADPGEATRASDSPVEEPKSADPSAGNTPAPNNTPDPSAAVPQNGS